MFVSFRPNAQQSQFLLSLQPEVCQNVQLRLDALANLWGAVAALVGVALLAVLCSPVVMLPYTAGDTKSVWWTFIALALYATLVVLFVRMSYADVMSARKLYAASLRLDGFSPEGMKVVEPIVRYVVGEFMPVKSRLLMPLLPTEPPNS